MADRSHDVSTALTEVRTVRSRALSAIYRLDSEWAGEDYDDPDFPAFDGYEGPGGDRSARDEWWRAKLAARIRMADPDHDEMRAALEKVAELLEPWAKKARRSR